MARDPGPALSMSRQVLASGMLVFVALGLWFGGGAALELIGAGAEESGGRAGRTRAPAPVIVAPVTQAADTLSVQLVGTGRAHRSVALRSEADGKVVSIALAAGVRFEAGAVLMKLDDEDARLALELAETRLVEAQRVLSRFRRLEGSGAAASATLDDAATKAEIARIEVARARQELDNRTMRAPFAGVAGFPAVEMGDWVRTGDSVASYDDRSRILVEVEMPEAVLSRLTVGQAVAAETPSYRDRRFDGVVAAIDSRVDAATRTARVRLALDNADDLLRPGASFTIRFDLPGPVYPVAPELALQFSRGALFVWRVVDDTVERVDVSLVRRRSGELLLEGGLAPGDRVVVEGAQRLAPGRKVDVVQPAEAAPEGSPS